MHGRSVAQAFSSCDEFRPCAPPRCRRPSLPMPQRCPTEASSSAVDTRLRKAASEWSTSTPSLTLPASGRNTPPARHRWSALRARPFDHDFACCGAAFSVGCACRYAEMETRDGGWVDLALPHQLCDQRDARAACRVGMIFALHDAKPDVLRSEVVEGNTGSRTRLDERTRSRRAARSSRRRLRDWRRNRPRRCGRRRGRQSGRSTRVATSSRV